MNGIEIITKGKVKKGWKPPYPIRLVCGLAFTFLFLPLMFVFMFVVSLFAALIGKVEFKWTDSR